MVMMQATGQDSGSRLNPVIPARNGKARHFAKWLRHSSKNGGWRDLESLTFSDHSLIAYELKDFKQRELY